MKALWIGPDLPLVETVLLSLQSRWPDAQIHVTQSVSPVIDLIDQGDFEVAFVYLGAENTSDTFNVIRELRDSSEIPLIAIAESTCELDRIKALYMGCDNVISADSGPIEVQANTMAILRRVHGHTTEVEGPVQLGDLHISPATHEVYLRGRRIHLTPTEFRLIHALARRQGTVATHDVLLRAIWGKGADGNGNVLRKYVQRLRSKLKDDSEHPNMIVTVPSIGYRLVRAGAEVREGTHDNN